MTIPVARGQAFMQWVTFMLSEVDLPVMLIVDLSLASVVQPALTFPMIYAAAHKKKQSTQDS